RLPRATWPARAGLRSGLFVLRQSPGHTKTGKKERNFRRQPETASRTRLGRRRSKRPAPQHPALGISNRSPVVLLLRPLPVARVRSQGVLTPFPGVSIHVKQAIIVR